MLQNTFTPPLTDPKAVPNTPMDFLTELVHVLPADKERLLFAPSTMLGVAPHVGFVVQIGPRCASTLPASCVVTLLAHVSKSKVEDLTGGHRIVTKDCYNMLFEVCCVSEGAPEHTDEPLQAHFGSFCTMDDVQYHSMSEKKPKTPFYSLAAVVSGHDAGGHRTYMVDKVQEVSVSDIDRVKTLSNALSRLSLRSDIAEPPAIAPKRTAVGRYSRMGYEIIRVRKDKMTPLASACVGIKSDSYPRPAPHRRHNLSTFIIILTRVFSASTSSTSSSRFSSKRSFGTGTVSSDRTELKNRKFCCSITSRLTNQTPMR